MMPKRFIIILLLSTAIFTSCKRKHNPNGTYYIYKVVNGKQTDSGADNALKQKYLNKSFLMMFSKAAVSISDVADPRPMLLHRMNGKNGIVSYTPGGYDAFYKDTSPVRLELQTRPSDTLLFISDRFFLSAQSASSGKSGGMIICHLSKIKR